MLSRTLSHIGPSIFRNKHEPAYRWHILAFRDRCIFFTATIFAKFLWPPKISSYAEVEIFFLKEKNSRFILSKKNPNLKQTYTWQAIFQRLFFPPCLQKSRLFIAPRPSASKKAPLYSSISYGPTQATDSHAPPRGFVNDIFLSWGIDLIKGK